MYIYMCIYTYIYVPKIQTMRHSPFQRLAACFLYFQNDLLECKSENLLSS